MGLSLFMGSKVARIFERFVADMAVGSFSSFLDLSLVAGGVVVILEVAIVRAVNVAEGAVKAPSGETASSRCRL